LSSPFSPISEIIEEFKKGRMIVLVDAASRENEGDLVIPAEKASPEAINFMLRYARGVLCICLTEDRCRELHLHPQTSETNPLHGTAFMVTVDAASHFGVTTGVSAQERSTTIHRIIDKNCKPTDLVRPGHINPLRARDGGVLVRAGQTEGSVDLARLAGLNPSAVIIEVMNEDGTMARVPELTTFCKQHDLKMCSVADLIEYRIRREPLITRAEEIEFPTQQGVFKLIAYESFVDRDPHIALCCGGVGELDDAGNPVVHEEPVLVRVHSECMTGDVFGSLLCECGEQLDTALQAISEAGKGSVVYLRQEGRGIGLLNKLGAYRLQQQGMDTVEANEHLGFDPDRRDYGIGAQIIRDLGIKRLKILTNNPKKTSRLEVYGLDVAEQLPIQIPPNENNRRYLQTKKQKLGHLLDDL
jgi:3,4-dihydroxy 2-butanone 4-phosphate synthase/GTP cyclohydrolase II